MGRFCMFGVLIVLVTAALGWFGATVLLGFSGFGAVIVAAVISITCLLLLVLLARGIQRSKRSKQLRAMSEVDADGHPIFLEEQTAALRQLTGVAVGLLMPPQDVAKLSDDELVGALAASMRLTRMTSEYQSCFAELDPDAVKQVGASSSVAGQVQELYTDVLVERGWSQKRATRKAKALMRLSEMANRNRPAG